MDAIFARLFDTPFSFEAFDAVITPLALLLRLILPLGVAILLYRLLLTLLRHKIGRLRAQFDTAQRLYRYVRTILRTVLVALALLLVYGLFGTDASRGAVILWNILSTPIIETAGSSISLVTVIFAIPDRATWPCGRRAPAPVSSRRAPLRGCRSPTPPGSRSAAITHYLILSVTLVIGLSFLGINLSTFSVLVRHPGHRHRLRPAERGRQLRFRLGDYLRAPHQGRRPRGGGRHRGRRGAYPPALHHHHHPHRRDDHRAQPPTRRQQDLQQLARGAGASR